MSICILNRLTPPKHDPIFDEKLAGRRFLEALRQHDKMENHTSPVPAVQTASFNFGTKPKEDAKELKRKRMSLRASLEELLVEYLNLHSLTADSDGSNDDRLLRRRKRLSISPQTSASQRNERNSNENSDDDDENNVNNRELNNNIQSVENVQFDDKMNATENGTQTVCPQRRQRITQLDRTELAAAIQYVSEHEHNIRQLLNYRYVFLRSLTILLLN